jgi:hypothetical protein
LLLWWAQKGRRKTGKNDVFCGTLQLFMRWVFSGHIGYQYMFLFVTTFSEVLTFFGKIAVKAETTLPWALSTPCGNGTEDAKP